MTSAIENRNVRSCRRSLSCSSFANFLQKTGNEVSYGNLVHRAYVPAHDVIPPLRHPSTFIYTSPFNPTLTHPMYNSSNRYETFAPGGWAKPLYQYMNKTTRRHYNAELPNRVAPTFRHRSDTFLREARSSATYHPASRSMDFYQTDLDRAVDSYRRWNLGVVSTHPYYRDYYGNAGLRHFGGYRPRHTQHFLRAVWI